MSMDREQEKSAFHSSRRRIFAQFAGAAAGFAAVPAAARALGSNLRRAIEPEASDALFLKWEAEWNRYQDLFKRHVVASENVDRLADERMAFERLVLETPSATKTASAVKTRMLLNHDLLVMEDRICAALEHILAHLEGA